MAWTFSIKTLGCKLNQYESSLIAGQFTDNGWISRPFGETVDLVIINTCTVTNRSDKKCRNYIRQGAAFSRCGKIAVTGCLAERDGNDLYQMPEIFAVITNRNKKDILKIISEHYKNYIPPDEFIHNKESCRPDFNRLQKNDYPLPFFRTRGLLKIQDGCDGECSYCIVPSVRGKPSSRNYYEILEHARTLIAAGCPELILTGITIGKYNSDNKYLSDLVAGIADLTGDFRIRITSIEPNHVSDSLVEIFKNIKVCPHIHIPLQSGSDKILKLIRRPYSSAEYIKTVEKIKKINNNIAVGTDIIIGFPEETEEDFNGSLGMIKDAEFSYVHQFTYSPRSGTPSSELKECHSAEVSERAARLRKFAADTGLNYRKRFLGMNLSSIIEKNKGKKGYNAVSGNYIKMLIKELPGNIDEFTGKITAVRLINTDEKGSTGELL